MGFSDKLGGGSSKPSGGGGFSFEGLFKNLGKAVSGGARTVGRTFYDVGEVFSAPVHDVFLALAQGPSMSRKQSREHFQDIKEHSRFFRPLAEEVYRRVVPTKEEQALIRKDPVNALTHKLLLPSRRIRDETIPESVKGQLSGEGLREMAGDAPAGLVLPVLNTLSNLTTPEGRSFIAEHPGLTLLDVLPVKALKGGKAGASAARIADMAEGSPGAIKARAALAPLRARVSRKGAAIGAEVPAAMREATELVRRRTEPVIDELAKLSPDQYEELNFRLPRGIQPPETHPLRPAYDAYADYTDASRAHKLGRLPPREWWQILREKTLEAPSKKTGMVFRDRLVSGLTGGGLNEGEALRIVEDMSQAFLRNAPNPHPRFAKTWDSIQREYRRNVRRTVQTGRLHEEPLTGEVFSLEEMRQVKRGGPGRKAGPEALGQYLESLSKVRPGRFATLTEEFERARANLTNKMLTAEGFGPAAVRQAVADLETSMGGNWLELVQQDNPVYVHRIPLKGPLEEAAAPRPRPALARPGSLQSSQGLAPHYADDAGWAMLADEFDDATQHTMMKAVANVYERSGGKSYGRLLDDLKAKGFSDEAANKLIKRSRRSVDVDSGKVSVGEAKPGDLTIPREVADVLEHHTNPKVFRSGADKFLNYWMFPTLWLAPVFHANNIIGGAILTALRTEPNLAIWRDFGEAVSAAKRGRVLDPRIPMGTAFVPSFRKLLAPTAEAAAAEMYGAKLGQAASKWLRHPIQASERMNQFFDRMYRNFIYLNQRSAGRSADLAVGEAVRLMQDYDSMLPIERELFQRIYPFWGWKRTLIKHAMTYPVDHPIRTIILNQATRQHMQDQELSEALDRFLLENVPITGADAEGYRTYVSLRGLNPFADYANMASWKGWIASIHPLYRAGLESVGYDPYVGGARAFAGSEDIVTDPETGAQVRRLDPAAFAELIPQMRAVQTATGLEPPSENTAEGWMRWWDIYGPSLRLAPGLTKKKIGTTPDEQRTSSLGGFAGKLK